MQFLPIFYIVAFLPRRLFPGDIVEIAPDVEHWHGAAPDSLFAHIAITTNPQNNATLVELPKIGIYGNTPKDSPLFMIILS